MPESVPTSLIPHLDHYIIWLCLPSVCYTQSRKRLHPPTAPGAGRSAASSARRHRRWTLAASLARSAPGCGGSGVRTVWDTEQFAWVRDGTQLQLRLITSKFGIYPFKRCPNKISTALLHMIRLFLARLRLTSSPPGRLFQRTRRSSAPADPPAHARSSVWDRDPLPRSASVVPRCRQGGCRWTPPAHLAVPGGIHEPHQTERIQVIEERVKCYLELGLRVYQWPTNP